MFSPTRSNARSHIFRRPFIEVGREPSIMVRSDLRLGAEPESWGAGAVQKKERKLGLLESGSGAGVRELAEASLHRV